MASRKRQASKIEEDDAERRGEISFPLSYELIKNWREKFDTPQNLVIRNALSQDMVDLLLTNTNEADKTNHYFVNTIKGEGVKASNQGHSGRCWMFAGFNVFRYFIMKFFDIKNFEFSASYLYFYHVLESSNVFINDIINTLDVELKDYEYPEDRNAIFIGKKMRKPFQDGAYWASFASLVKKYGLVPDSAMPDRINSFCSGDLIEQINRILRSHAFYLRKNYKKMTIETIISYREEIMHQIYDTLVKFLGKPPEKFDWAFQNRDHECQIVADYTPIKFSKIIFSNGLNIDDYIVLGNFPELSYNKVYALDRSTMMAGGSNQCFLNLPIRELERYAYKSICKEFPVYFACDVYKDHHSGLFSFNKNLMMENLVFGEVPSMNKAERLLNRDSAPNHAMVFTGADIRTDGALPYIWQVENSWGSVNSDEAGLDGYYVMTDEWFEDHVYEIVVYRLFLSKAHQKLLNQIPIVLPFDSVIA
jgi:bleomycin hydrolase